VHISLSRVVPYDTIDHDDFFAVSEPSILTPESTSSLSWRRRKIEPIQRDNVSMESSSWSSVSNLPRNHANNRRQPSFKHKEPTPALPTSMPTKKKNARSEESTDDIRQIVSAPKAGQPDGKLFVLVKVAKIENYVGDEASLKHAQETPCDEECSSSSKSTL
jgi:hypothetical protein